MDQHCAGQIEEIDSGTRWVVDSWFYDYGSLPYVEESRECHDIPFLSAPRSRRRRMTDPADASASAAGTGRRA